MFGTGLLLALLAAAPSDGRLAPTNLKAIADRERIWDSVEAFVDSKVCGAYKQGYRRAPADAVAADANLPLHGFAEVRSCSLRALQFLPGDGGWDALMLYEVEGFGAEGERRTRRGEADAQLRHSADAGWSLASLASRWTADVARSDPQFELLPQNVTGTDVDAPTKPASYEELQVMRGGLGVLDVDSDGLLDLLITARPQAQLFRNIGGFRFEKTAFSFAPPKGASLGPPGVADFDNDGDPDVILTLATNGEGRAFVFRNDKGQLSALSSFAVTGWVAGAVPWDFDGDGRLDLTLVRYGRSPLNPNDFLESTNGRTALFFRGDGKLGFKPIPAPSAKNRWGLAAVAAPLDAQNVRSLYVANDYGSNDLFSYRAGAFVQRADAKGLRDPGNGMSADVGDINGDGRLDLYVANMFSKAGTRVLSSARLEGELGALLQKFAAGNTLYLAKADGGYDEVAQARGVNRGLWAFGSPFLDANDDGLLDLAVTNGYQSKPDRKDL